MLIAEGERVKVSGYYYGLNMAGYVQPVKDITIALQRGPRAIAREISNRLLSQYLESYARGVERKQKMDAAEAARIAVMESLAAIIEQPLHNCGIYMSIPWLDTTQEDPMWQKASVDLDASMNSVGYGHIRMASVPVPLMRKLLEVIQEYRKEM
jgi:hypothetical protein